MWSDMASAVTSDIFYEFQIQDLFGNLANTGTAGLNGPD